MAKKGRLDFLDMKLKGGPRLRFPHRPIPCRGVRPGMPGTFAVGDMPLFSYQVAAPDALLNAGRLRGPEHSYSVLEEQEKGFNEVVARYKRKR